MVSKKGVDSNELTELTALPSSTTNAKDTSSGDEEALGEVTAQEVPRRVKFRELFRYATTFDWILMSIGMFSAAIAGALLPFTTVVFGNLVNTFSVTPNSPLLGNLTTVQREAFTEKWRQGFLSDVRNNTLFFLYLAAFTFVTTYRMTHRMREKYLWAVLRQDVPWHETQGAGEVATRITTDMLLFQDAVSEKVPIAASQIFTFIAAFGIAFYRSWRMTLVLLSVVPLIVISFPYSKAGTVAEECISAIRTVAALNAQDRMSTRYTQQLQQAVKFGIKKAVVTGAGTGILFMFIYLAYSLAFYYGSILLQNNQIDAGIVVNVFFAILIGAFALGQIAPELQAFALGMGAGSKILATLDRVPRPDVPIMTNLNLKFEAGATTALVGLSGSGKSTLIQLIERFYDPNSGVVELDGQKLTDLNVLWLRRQIGLVSQEPTLFEGTIAENIAKGLIGTPEEKLSREAQLELVKQASIMANAHEFVNRLPNGYATQVGERGFMLSGGQKQRIAIARAIIKNPQILLLDEATSALDTVSERIVQQALDNASKGRTTVVIAHRLSTVRSADRIVSGSHDELMNMETGLYRGLVEAQQLKTVEEKEEEEEEKGDPDAVLGAAEVVEEKEEVVKSLFDLRKRGSVGGPVGDKRKSKASDLEMVGGEKKPVEKITTWRVIKEVYKLNKPELGYTIPGLVAATIAGLVIPFFSIIFSSIIQAFSSPEPQRTNDIRFWASMFVVIAVITAITNFLQNALFGIANERLTDRIRRLLFRAILRQDMAFFASSDTPTPSIPLHRCAKIQGAAGVTLGTALQLLATLLGARVGRITTLPILIGAGAFRIMVLTHFSNNAEKSHARSAQVACEGVAAIRTVQGLTAEVWVHERYLGMLEGPLKDGYKAAASGTVLYAFSQCVNFLGNALVFWYGGQLIAYENYEVKNFFVVFMAVIFGSISAGRIFAFVPDVTKARSAGEAGRPLAFTGTDKTHTVNGRIELKDVWFSYATEEGTAAAPVLRGLNLTVEPGQFVALSTVLGLLERFYDVDSGSVLIDGQDVKDIRLRDLRSVVGIVSQEPGLFDMSVEENILLGLIDKEEIGVQVDGKTDARVEQSAKEANVHDFVTSLPEGYKTTVGTRGSRLSGGQKQRVAIARALIATSALDAESERVVQDALDRAAKGRTTVAVAHRLSSIQHADVIFVLRDGGVAERGTHQELYNMKGLYYELAVQQNLDVGAGQK
ncbi:P-loop containing nucleoside triphosphate hydrolase protein [Chytridium lagenaria]|nr:P-loop containing nucleoside triphosphate hydrolase protein [Chytridium lagenaria]